MIILFKGEIYFIIMSLFSISDSVVLSAVKRLIKIFLMFGVNV